jgi:alpha-glucosidase (family GH31 glycosyl hydrolase)
MLVAPVTTPGTTATTSVWFPPGQWTDYFTGQTYTGGTTRNVTTDLNSMPVFVKAGAVIATRTNNVTDQAQNPLDKVTVTVPEGASGSFSLYEDDGSTTDSRQSATTKIRYSESGKRHTVTITPAGHYHGQPNRRQWTVTFLDAAQPTGLAANGIHLADKAYHWDATTRTLTVTLPVTDVHTPVVLSYQ